MPDENGKYINPEDRVDLSDLDSLSEEELRWAADRSLLTPDQMRQYGLDRPHDPGAPELPAEEVGDVDTAAYHGVQVPSGPTMDNVGPDSTALDAGNEVNVESYNDATVDQLKAEIDARNEDPERSADDHLSKSGTKDELIARLEADDEKYGA